MFGTSGRPGQFKNIMKKYLNFFKHLQEALNAFGSVLKVEIRFLQLLKWQLDVAPSNGSNLQLNIFSLRLNFEEPCSL